MFHKKSKASSAPSRFSTLIAQGTRSLGDVSFSGGLHVDGEIIGTVHSAGDDSAILRLSEDALVEGDIIAPNVVINGRVLGDVYVTGKLELAAKASITGNVYYHLIEMCMGAEVNGSLVHDQAAAKLRLQQEEGDGLPEQAVTDSELSTAAC